jgi:MFS family permease
MFTGWRVVRTFNRSIWTFLIVWGLIGFTYFGIQGVLLNLYLLRLGFSPDFIGILLATGHITWAVVALPAGMIGRQIGLRAALITANSLTTLAMVLLLLVEAIPRHVWASWLLGCWALLWAGAALATVNSIPFLMQVCTAAERNHAFTAQRAVIGLMGFVGSLVAGMLPGLFAGWLGDSLDQPTPYKYALWIAPLSYALCTFAWVSVRPVQLLEEAQAEGDTPKPLAILVFFATVVFLQTAAEGTVDAFFNVYLDTQLHMPTAQIGAIVGVGQLLSILVVLITPQLLNRWGSSFALALTTAGTGIALLLLAALVHWFPAALGFTAFMAMTAMGDPIRSIFSQEIVSARWRTTTSAIASISIALGLASAAAAGGYLIAYVGFNGLFFTSAIVSFVASVPLLSYRRARRAATA